MHEHTWLDYQDGGPLKCPCGLNQLQFVSQGGALPSQDTTQASETNEAASQSADSQTETATADTQTPFRETTDQPEAQSVSNEPAAETASVEGTDFAFTQQGDTPVQPVTPPEEQPSETGAVAEAPADTKSLNEVARSIIDEAMTKLTQLKEML